MRRDKQREDTLTQVNMSPRNQHRNENQSVDAIYQSAAFDLVKSAGSEKGNH